MILFTADLHFTDLPRDEHRWALLPWLKEQARKQNVTTVILGGDLTDQKNCHSADLTNRLVDGLRDLARACEVIIIRGNHDYIDPATPFFGFMDGEKNLAFIKEPTYLQDIRTWLLPNTRGYQTDWKGLDFNKAEYIFCHQTFDGALSEMGDHALTGIPPSVFGKTKAQVYSGDIHKAQRLTKQIVYVGSPYRCRFGESHTPRVLLIRDDGTTKDLHFPTKNKMTIDLFDTKDAVAELREKIGKDGPDYEGDQVKVRVHMPRATYAEWPAIKRQIVTEAAEMGLELTGPELLALPEPKKPAKGRTGAATGAFGPGDALVAFASAKGLDGPLLKAGESFLKVASR